MKHVAKNFPTLLPTTKKCTIQLYGGTIQVQQYLTRRPRFELQTSLTLVLCVHFQSFFFLSKATTLAHLL